MQCSLVQIQVNNGLDAGKKKDTKKDTKRTQSHPRKRWIDVMGKDLEDLGLQKWKKILQNRDGWNDLVMADKILGEY